MDPSWNPASDLQAIDRAYRLGCKRDVTVFRLISVGTIQENIYRRQFYKQQQANVAIENIQEPRYFEGHFLIFLSRIYAHDRAYLTNKSCLCDLRACQYPRLHNMTGFFAHHIAPRWHQIADFSARLVRRAHLRKCFKRCRQYRCHCSSLKCSAHSRKV